MIFAVKPIIILPPDAMSADDIKLLRGNELCVVIAKNPALVKFVDPIPAISSRTEIETAAIRLSRRLLNGAVYDENARGTFAKMFVDILIQGTALDKNGTQEEKEQAVFDAAKTAELQRLAKEEAKAERLVKTALQK